ncbi:unnamed protein product, partial [Polarella glacialis]
MSVPELPSRRQREESGGEWRGPKESRPVPVSEVTEVKEEPEVTDAGKKEADALIKPEPVARQAADVQSKPEPSAAEIPSFGALLPSGKEEPRPILLWEHRWGVWQKEAVCVVAPLVAQIDVVLSSDRLSLLEVGKEIHEQLDKALPEENSVLFVHDDGLVKKKRRFR